MSNYERNVGKLIPVKFDDAEDWAEKLAGDMHKETAHTGYDSFLEMITDDPYHYGVQRINGKFYTVEFKIEGGDAIDEWCNIIKNDDGSIDFDTYHYNGGAHWTELLEDKLPK